jgi:pimeloyl-ACP methyl ester carboxylesterase
MTTSQTAQLSAFRSAEGKARYHAAYDAVLQEWPVPFEELDVPTRFGTTHVVASGPRDAPPLVLLPSLAASATLWRPNVAALSAHHRVYAVDVIGQTGKSVQTRKLRDRAGLADWLADVLDGLGVRRTSIVGASYGGFIAMNQASRTPERVERVVLIGPAGVFVGFSWKVIGQMLIRGLWRKLVAPKRKRDIADLLGPHARLKPADQRWREQMAITMTDSAIPDTLWNLVLDDAQLSAVKAPTLLLIGEHEQLYAPSTLAVAQRRMPGLTGAVIADAHHLAALAQPEDVNRRILEFLGARACPSG